MKKMIIVKTGDNNDDKNGNGGDNEDNGILLQVSITLMKLFVDI